MQAKESGLSKDDFIEKLKASFEVEEMGSEIYKPEKLQLKKKLQA